MIHQPPGSTVGTESSTQDLPAVAVPSHAPAPRRPARRWRQALLVVVPALLIAGGLRWLSRDQPQPAQQAVPAPVQPRLQAVSALGRLTPEGDVRRLAAPSGAMGAMPRVSELLVEVGDQVQQGQLLARFDNQADAQADLNVAKATINSLERREQLLRGDVERYLELQELGAISLEGLELRQLKLLALQQELALARAELARQQVKLPDSELRAPFAGTVLSIAARPGERAGADGVLQLGRSNAMQALLEVYESDVDRVRIGQRVRLESENGGFDGTLRGRVIRIDPQVQQRGVLSTDPTADTDARVIEVRVALDPEDAARVSSLTGLRLIARLQP